MDWEALDARIGQVRIDSHLRDEEDQDYGVKANDQLSREASEIPEYPKSTTSST